MKKIIFFATLILNCNAQCAQKTTEIIEDNFSISAEHFIKNVHRRMYLIERLKNAMSVLLHFKDNTSRLLQKQLLHIHTAYTFEHPLIAHSIKTIREEGTLRPLSFIWKRFSSYKAVSDDLLAEELTKAVFIISQYLCGSPKNNLHAPLNIEDLLDSIDTYVESLTKKHKRFPIDAPNYLTNLHNDAQSDNIILRFYCIKRTQKAKKVVLAFNKKQRLIPSECNIEKHTNTVSINGIIFRHPLIVARINAENCDGLIGIVRDFERYKHIHDTEFTHEYALILLTLSSQIHFVLHKNITSSNDINNANLETILDAIDLIIEELPPMLEKYEFHSVMQWKEWLQKYWWAPMVISATLGLKIWFMIQNQTQSA